MNGMKYLCYKKLNTLTLVCALFFSIVLTAQSKIIGFDETAFENALFDSIGEQFDSVKVVGLGEATHFHGGTMSAKVKMVKYLHEHCNFDILAFESAMYDLSIVGNKLAKGEITKIEIANNISGVWRSQELDELFEYIVETQKTSRPLIYVGIDAKFFGPYNIGKDFNVDYSNFITKVSKLSNSEVKVDSTFYNILDVVRYNSYSYKKIPPTDTLLLHKKFNEIYTLLDKLNYKEDDYLYFWRQMTSNLQAVYRLNYTTNYGSRDYCMFQNALYYTHKYPNKKMIIWGATYHLANKLTSMDYYNKKGVENQVLGVHLKNSLGNSYYSIGFAPYSGTAGMEGYLGLMKRKVHVKSTSIERYFKNTYGTTYGFINLRSPIIQSELKNSNLDFANLLGTMTRKMNIVEVVDGIFYLENEKMVHPLGY